ncbi:MAG: hypothetical protein MHPSP_004240, partial [Paramarteilia canceri]
MTNQQIKSSTRELETNFMQRLNLHLSKLESNLNTTRLVKSAQIFNDMNIKYLNEEKKIIDQLKKKVSETVEKFSPEARQSFLEKCLMSSLNHIMDSKAKSQFTIQTMERDLQLLQIIIEQMGNNDSFTQRYTLKVDTKNFLDDSV